MLLFLFYQILSGNQVDSCVKLAGKGCVQLLAGGVLYLICLMGVKIIWKIDVTQTESYNGLNVLQNHILFKDIGLNWKGRLMEMLISMKSSIDSRVRFLSPNGRGILLVSGAVLAIVSGYCMCAYAHGKKREKMFAMLLVVLLPIGMNISFFLSGISHALMEYSWVFAYLFAFLIFRIFYRRQVQKRRTVYLCAVSFFLVLAILWNGVVSANNLYIQHDLQDKSRLSFLTRILYRLEEESL